MAKRGIDISAWQGNIDLATLKNNGSIDFAIIRVGYGTNGTLDTKFKRNADLCKSIGLPFGFYWYSYALNVDGAKREAQHFLNAIAPYKDSYSYGCWFDMEDADGYKKKNGMPSNQTLRQMCATFCKTVQDAGYYVGIYASASWFNNQLNGDEIKPYDKWWAQWFTSGGKQKALNTKPEEMSGKHLWQFTSDAVFTGFNGRLDTNYAYVDFPALIRGTTPTPTPTPTKSIDEIAQEVIDGKWGNGEDRKNRLTSAGYDYNAVQNRVNEILSPKPKKSNDEIAQEVINGAWGNGEDRKKRLTEAGYNYDTIQNLVNKKLNGGSSTSTTYKVVSGDTLSGIGAKFGVDWHKIASLNGIAGPKYIIYAGQTLKIPR